jgi:hypothetical protein
MEPTATTGGGGTVVQAATKAVTPDPETAELLAKRSQGAKLTPAEYGKLGAFASKVKSIFQSKGGKSSPAPGQAQPGSPAGNPAALATVLQGDPEGERLAPVPVDPSIVQRTTHVVLNRCEAVARRVVTNAAREAGADDRTLTRVDTAARIPKDDRELMVGVSPDVAAALGVDPKNYPLTVFFGTFGAWAADLWLIVQEFKASKKEAAPAASQGKPEPVPIYSQSYPVPPLPDPPPPKGAPPIVT